MYVGYTLLETKMVKYHIYKNI